MAAAKKKAATAEVPATAPERTFQILTPGQIRTGKNIRKEFDDEKHQALVESIRINDILEPLLVIHSDKSGEFDLIAGERRIRAARVVGLEKIPCFVYPPLSDPELYDIMMTENLLRSDLNAIEEAEGIQKLLELGMKQEELGTRMGRSQEYISNRLRLLEAPAILQEKIISREINPSHVLAILSMKNYPFFEEYANFFVRMNTARCESEEGAITVKEITEHEILRDFVNETSDVNNGKLFLRMRTFYEELDISYTDLKCYSCDKRRSNMGVYNGGVCFDQTCFPGMLETAKKTKEEKKKTDSKSKVNSYDIDDWLKAKEGTPKPEKLDVIPFYKSQDYNFKSRPVSIVDCERKKCEHCDSASGVCKDPVCFNKEYKAAMKKIRADSKVYQKDIEKAIGDTIFQMTDDELINVIADRHVISGAELRDVNKFFGTSFKDLRGDVPRRTVLQFYVASFFRSEYAAVSSTAYSKDTIESFKRSAKRYGLKTDLFDDILKKGV